MKPDSPVDRRRMNMNRSTSRRLASKLTRGALALGLAAGAFAQDEKPPIRPELDDILPGAGAERSAQEEMVELFQTVERRLHEMGAMLTEASAGDRTRLAAVSKSGIEDLIQLAQPQGAASGGVGDLLAASRGHGKQALQEIDRILEIAAQNGGT